VKAALITALPIFKHKPTIMKQIFVAAICLSLLACTNQQTVDNKPMIPNNMHGFTPDYSASFVMDDAANSETVLSIWKDWKNGDLGPARAHFADSCSFAMADGSFMTGPTDELFKGMQDYRNSFTGMEVSVDAIFAVKSTDKNENWVTVWGTEVQTSADGNVDSVSLQETWRFNKDGKVDFMMQAARKGVLPPTPED
jgi:hypothetical protein